MSAPDPVQKRPLTFMDAAVYACVASVVVASFDSMVFTASPEKPIGADMTKWAAQVEKTHHCDMSSFAGHPIPYMAQDLLHKFKSHGTVITQTIAPQDIHLTFDDDSNEIKATYMLNAKDPRRPETILTDFSEFKGKTYTVAYKVSPACSEYMASQYNASVNPSPQPGG